MIERPSICYIFEKLGVQGCQIYMTFPMCQSHSTRPQPIQLVPTMQKKLFMSSFQAKFLNWVKKVTCTCSFLHVIFLFLVSTSPGPYFGQKVLHSLPSNTQKWPKMAKNSVWKIVVPFTFTLNRKKIAVYFLQIFTYSDRFRDMAVWSWNSCGSDFPNEFIASVQLN